MDTEKAALGKRQSKMHKDFFDRAEEAIASGYYLEAIFLEYAAIEGRLEVILGILGRPCNKGLECDLRAKVNISTRIQCINKIKKKNPFLFEGSKLGNNYFNDRRHKGELANWIADRNTYVHGLYKDAMVYGNRNAESEQIATTGIDLARRLFNEAKRLGRLAKSHPELFDTVCKICDNWNCVASTKKREQQEA